MNRRAADGHDQRDHGGEGGEHHPRGAVRVERLQHETEDRRAGEQPHDDRGERDAAQQARAGDAARLGADDEVDADPAVGPDSGEEGEQR